MSLTVRALSAAALLLGAAGVAGAGRNAGSTLTLVTPGEPGNRLVITATVVDARGLPLADARVHVYQTDATGRYTRERAMDEPHARLSGWLRTDAQGRFELHTIRPGGYPKAVRLGDRDRKIPAHIHMDITAPGHPERRLQAVFADDPLLADPYWQDWVKSHGHPVLTVHQEGDTAVASLRIALPPVAGAKDR
jgi:protocatechuate 3,4-dioxygenase, beta subunit